MKTNPTEKNGEKEESQDPFDTNLLVNCLEGEADRMAVMVEARHNHQDFKKDPEVIKEAIENPAGNVEKVQLKETEKPNDGKEPNPNGAGNCPNCSAGD